MMKRLCLFCVSALLLALCGCSTPEQQWAPPAPPEEQDKPTTPDKPDTPVTPDNPDTPPTDADLERLARLGQTPVVAVYFTEYTTSAEFPTLEDVRCFTHINVGHARFKNPKTGDGGLEIKNPGPDYLKKLAAYKTSYPELKLLLFIGGWGKNADGFSEMAKNPDKRALFCSECVRLCNEYNLDGVDLDWEYPTYAAKTYLDDGTIYYNGADPADKQNFSILMKELREALGKDKLISFAASSDDYHSANYINYKEVMEWVDFINVMTYSMGDPYPQDPSKQRHNSPLYTSARFNNARGGADCIEGYHNEQGIPYDRMNYGIGFYGHGDGNVYPSSVSYAMAREALEKGTVNGKSIKGFNTRWWDEPSKSCFLGDSFGVMYASYEDIESIGYRVDYLKSKGLLGAFAWEYREDDARGTLRRALWNLMHGLDPGPDPSTDPSVDPGDDPVQPAELPVMGKVEWSKKLQNGTDYVPELSGLCLSKDGDFLWGVHDKGTLYRINFDGTYEKQWYREADFEALAIDPATGDLYIGLESTSKSVYKVPYPNYNGKVDVPILVEGVASMGNSGVEGIAWYKGELLFGTQTGATLFWYSMDGTQKLKKSLRTVAPTISEIGGMDYDPEHDWLWVIDSNSNKDKPQYDPYTIYLFKGLGEKLLAKYPIGDFADWNPEAICVDKKNGCIWVGEDCDSSYPSILHKVQFTNL